MIPSENDAGGMEDRTMVDDKWEVKVADLRERLVFLAEDLAPSRGKYDYLEKRTGISAARWKNLFLRKLAPNADMILAIISHRQPFSEWLLTGYVGNAMFFGQREPEAEYWNEFVKQQKYLERKRKKANHSEIEPQEDQARSRTKVPAEKKSPYID